MDLVDIGYPKKDLNLFLTKNLSNIFAAPRAQAALLDVQLKFNIKLSRTKSFTQNFRQTVRNLTKLYRLQLKSIKFLFYETISKCRDFYG